MRVLQLSLRNYRVFEEVDLELPARVIGIFGSNGSGKSALMESLLFGLYGKARTSKEHIRTDGILTDCAVRLVFEHGGQQYEVRRTIKGKNHQTEAELFAGDAQLAAGVSEVDQEIQRLLRMDQQVFRASVFAEQKQLDAFSDVTKGKRKEMVLRLLGIRPVDEARTAARKEGRDRKADAERLGGTLPDPAEQKAALAEASKAAEAAEKEAAKASTALKEADDRASAADKAFEESDAVRERVEKMAIERKGLQEQAGSLEGQRDELTERIRELTEDLKAFPAMEKEHAGLAGADEKLTAARKVAEAADEVGRLEKEAEGLPEVDAAEALDALKAADREHRAAEKAHGKAETARDRATEDLAEAEEVLERAADADPSQPCPTCGRPLGDDFKEYVAHCRKAVQEQKKKVTETGRVLREATAALKAAEKRFKEVEREGTRVQKAAEARSRIDENLARARKRLEDLSEPFAGKTPDVEALERDAARARELGTRLTELRNEQKHLTRTQADLKKAAAALEKAAKRIAVIDEESGKLGFDAEDHRRLRKERDESATLLEQARRHEREESTQLKDAQTKVKELEGRIQEIEKVRGQVEGFQEEARVLERVSVLLEGFRGHLYGRIVPELSREAEALFRELTNHEYDDLRIHEDTLAIEIADGTRYFPVERFSGSEADLANLALRVAISAHLSRMSGADVGMLVLDEVLASLDAERKDLFVQAIGRLAGRFHQLFVITHSEQVKDQFPASIEVRKTGRRRSQPVLV